MLHIRCLYCSCNSFDNCCFCYFVIINKFKETMETPSGDGSSTRLTAAELRERRRLRILANADNRIDKILGGAPGEAKRQAPVMEGGDFRTSSGGENSPLGQLFESAVPTPSVTVPSSSSESLTGALVKRRFEFAGFVGCFLAVLAFLFGPFNLIVPWIVIFASVEYLANANPSFNNQPNILTEVLPLLSQFGIDQKNTSKIVTLYNSARSFSTDTAVFVVVFLVTNGVLSKFA